MLTLTSAQEAALNAAGETMADLAATEGGYLFYLSRGYRGEGFRAFTNDAPGCEDSVWGEADTAAGAVADLFRKAEEALLAPPKLTTAREMRDAVVKIVADNSSKPAREIYDAINALPIA